MPRRTIGALTVMVLSLLGLQLAMALPAFAASDISISPRSGPPGATILITGSDFDEGTVAFCWGERNCANLGKTSTNGDGGFSQQVSVPENARPGVHVVSACQQGGNGRSGCGWAFFLVTSSSTTTTVAPTTTTLAPTTTTTVPPTTTTVVEPTTTSVVVPAPTVAAGPDVAAQDAEDPVEPDPTTTTIETDPTLRLEALSLDPPAETTTTADTVPPSTSRYVPPRSEEAPEVLGESLVADPEVTGQIGAKGDVEVVEAAPEESHPSQGALPWVLLVAGIGVFGAAGAMVVHYVRRPQ